MTTDHEKVLPIQLTLKDRLRITGMPEDLRNEVMEKLSFDNPKWIENHRMGRWNRGTPKILKFYAKAAGHALIVPRGCIRQIIHLCSQHSATYEIADHRRELAPVAYCFSGSLRPYQQIAVNRMLKKDFGTMSAPTGSGKTIMALYMIAMRKQPALVVVHTKELAFQWMKRISTFLDIPENEIGFIGDGKHRAGEIITVALIQSLYRCVDEVFKQTGHLIVDECHRIPSRTFTEAVTGFDCKYMLGLSATPWRRDGLSRLIFWYMGGVHYEMDAEKLIEEGAVLKAEVVVRETEFKPYFDPVKEYSRMLSELVADDARNRLIASDVAQEVEEGSGVCLILSDRKSHCQTLHALLTYGHKIDAELLTGDVSAPERRAVLDRINSGQVRVLVATGQLIGEGFDCSNLSTLFMATPVRFSGRVLQYLGRILRPAPGKSKARVFDYVDSRVDILKSAAEARKRIYG